MIAPGRNVSGFFIGMILDIINLNVSRKGILFCHFEENTTEKSTIVNKKGVLLGREDSSLCYRSIISEMYYY